MTNDVALALLRAEVERTSITATAAKIGYSRPAVSAVLSGKYDAGTSKLLLRAYETLAMVDCPHLEREISPAECRRYASGEAAGTSPLAMRHVRTCRTCPHGGKS